MEKIVIDNKLDANFKYEIAARPGGENIKKCFACGTCTAGCPVFHVEHEYNPRKIIRMILLGMREQVLSSRIIWFCAQCYTCSANCPQEVDFSDIMFALRDMAVKEGYAPPDLLEKIDKISTAANEFRRDCIYAILREGDISMEQIRKNVDTTLEYIKENG
ncbi:MAG: 4Fe-4S dicluster domain-containing protein [Spirochaeta sp.]|nr:4Fe-4S dicluster domain-containing protein [Spirochaeta sp.]